MRRRNWRVIFTGLLLIVLALGFFFFMQPIAPTSTNPVEFMRTVGTVSGIAIGISISMIIIGLIGKKV